jgi:hypothetical protein
MSLISIENILEPFTNRVHLITIILVVFVFAILRLQGGGFTINTNIEPPRLHKKNVATRSAAGTAALPVAPKKEKQKYLDKMISEGDAEVDAYMKKMRQKKAEDDKGLSDIERSLGLK